MKKLVYSISLFFLLSSCVGISTNPQKANEEKVPPVIAFVDSFKLSHPDWTNNSVTKEAANNDYLEMIKDTNLFYSLTEGIDVKLSEIIKSKDGKYLGHFYAWYAQDEIRNHDIDKVMFDIATIIDDTLVNKLFENEEYKCKWRIVSSADYDTFCMLLGRNVTTIQATPKIEIEKYEGISLSLGLFYADLLEIKQ